jgi:RIO kinase 2
MATAEKAALYVKSLELEDLKVLYSLEKLLKFYKIVPEDVLLKVSKLNEKELSYRLKRLSEMEMILRTKIGCILQTTGLDALALSSLARKDIVVALGKVIGAGKESDLYEGLGKNNERFAVKFFRIGRISFRNTRRKRDYTTPEKQHHWMIVNIGAAKKEFNALKRLKPFGVKVPEVISRDRHVVVMELINGVRLSDAPELNNPKNCLFSLLNDIKIAYCNAKIVNADLSEFNVLFDGANLWIIDWPQAIDANHPNAKDLLRRDVENIVRFFKRKYKVLVNYENAYLFVSGAVDNLK